jgi:hypothetical protein
MQTRMLGHLEAFAKSIDGVSVEIESKLRDAIEEFISPRSEPPELNYDVLIQNTYPYGDLNSRVLIPRGPEDVVVPARGESCQSHAEYCFREGCDIWVYAKGGGLLKETDDYYDVFGHTNLPKYKSYKQEESRVSIVKVLRDESNKRVFGLFTVESSVALEYSRNANASLAKLANIISVVIRRARETEFKTDNTRNAVNRFLNLVEGSETFAKACAWPTVYYVQADKAEGDVLAIVCEAVTGLSATYQKKYGFGLNYRSWRDDARPINIMPGLLNDLRESVVGVVYLSESAGSAIGQFRDNMNVLYEAGFMHGLGAPFQGCLLIREAESGETPFDIAQTRTIPIRRGHNGLILDQKRIEAQVSIALSELLKEVL